MTTYSYHWAARPWPQFLPRMDPLRPNRRVTDAKVRPPNDVPLTHSPLYPSAVPTHHQDEEGVMSFTNIDFGPGGQGLPQGQISCAKGHLNSGTAKFCSTCGVAMPEPIITQHESIDAAKHGEGPFMFECTNGHPCHESVTTCFVCGAPVRATGYFICPQTDTGQTVSAAEMAGLTADLHEVGRTTDIVSSYVDSRSFSAAQLAGLLTIATAGAPLCDAVSALSSESTVNRYWDQYETGFLAFIAAS